MSLPSTFTTTIGTFSNPVEDGSSVQYYAPSPQGDLLGRPSLTFSNETTKAGIARTLVSIKVPIYNGTSAKYDGFYKTDLVINRALTAPTAAQEGIIESMGEVLYTATIFAVLAAIAF